MSRHPEGADEEEVAKEGESSRSERRPAQMETIEDQSEAEEEQEESESESQGDLEPEQEVPQPEPDDELDGLDRFYAMDREDLGCPTSPESDESAPGC